MKKSWMFYFLVVSLIFLLGVNEYFALEYDVGIPKYIKYSKGYTIEEEQILDKYSPIIYGGNISEPPLGIYYEENGQYVGLVVDHMNALSIQLGETIISRPMIWEQALEALKNGETDICDMIPSRERANFYDFTLPVYRLRGVLAGPKESDFLEPNSDWSNLKIGVQKSDYVIENLLKKVPKENIIYTDNVEEAVNLMKLGKVDAVAGDEPVIRYFINGVEDLESFDISPELIYEADCVLAVPKSKSDLVEVLNKGIFNLKKAGTLEKINQKWMIHSKASAQKNTEKLKLILTILVLIVFVTLYTAYMWNRSLSDLVKQRTKQLESAKKELEVTFNGISSYIALIDRDYRIKNINNPFANFLKISRKELLRMNYFEIDILKEFEKKNNNIIKHCLDYKTSENTFLLNNNFELKLQNGIFSIKVTPVEYEGEYISQVVVVIDNITTQKLNQEKLTQENKMSAVGQLAAGVAHELRNPLGIIRNAAFLLEDGCQDEEMKLMALGYINNSVERSGKIIDNLLNFSRMNNEKREIVNLRDITEEISILCRSIAKGKGAKVDINIGKNFEVFTNSISLRHILLNLIQNAVDAVGYGGIIDISAFKNENQIHIKICDNGDGINQKDIEKIFEPFYTTKEVGKGTGLGLYIVYTEVKKLNGEIKVESDELGTTFEIILEESIN